MTSADRWNDLTIIFGTCFWDGTPLLERHLATRLSTCSPVLYVEPPTSMATGLRYAEARQHGSRSHVRIVDECLAVLSIRVLPLKDRPGFNRVALAGMRRQVRSALQLLNSPRVGAVIVASMDPMLGHFGEGVQVYYAKDDYVAGSELIGIRRERTAQRIDELVRGADLVVAVSPSLESDMRKRGANTVMVPNGVDPVHFARTPPPPSGGSDPTVAFVGHLSARISVEHLEAVARRGVRLLMIGPRQTTLPSGAFECLAGYDNIVWVGGAPYDRLPDLLSSATTCLVPYSPTPFNMASFPLKILEYLASGRRVVATDLPAVRWLKTDLVTAISPPAAFADAVVESLERPFPTEEVDARKQFAAQHSWESRTQTLRAALSVAQAGLAPLEVSGTS